MGSIKGLGPFLKNELIFKEEDYVKHINERLSKVLRRNTSKNDFANIAIQGNMSFSTIRDVVYRTNSLTKLNANAISFLVHAAFENSFAYKLQAEGDILYLGNLLKF